ncbi:MAG: hypothetical protein ABWZ75_06895 [Novosphingobium sp.]
MLLTMFSGINAGMAGQFPGDSASVALKKRFVEQRLSACAG